MRRNILGSAIHQNVRRPVFVILSASAAAFFCFSFQWATAFAQDRATVGQPSSEIRIADQRPHWIWAVSESAKSIAAETPLRFLRSAQFESIPAEAELRLAADFCQSRLLINGQLTAEVAPFSQTLTLDVTEFLRPGENQFVLETVGIPGPCGIALSVHVRESSGKEMMVRTDESWRVSGLSECRLQDRGPVSAALWGISQRSIALSPFENYEQWRQAARAPQSGSETPSAATVPTAPKFWLPPGFQIHQLRTALPSEGSWISMAFDPQGRLIISREDRGLLRMTLDAQAKTVTQVESINEDLEECRGLLYAHDALYVNANNSKALYRLKDADDDGLPELVEKLREFPGGVGHGRNDLALGPDGWIYSIHGDSVEAPQPPVRDLTSPLRDSRRNRPKQEGYVIRTDPDGKRWEVVCTGLRNPYGIAFHPDGDAFTYDADNEYDMGTPWYRPTRIWQLVPGADFGWRVTQGTWPPYFPDTPEAGTPVLDIGKGSPTSVMFGTNCRFPVQYQRALFALDWAYGRVLAIHMLPRGTTWRCEPELFLQGKPLNVTDLASGPDGCLYLITGGRKTQSALYRVEYSGNASPAVVGNNLPPNDDSLHEQQNRSYAQEQHRASKPLAALLSEDPNPANSASRVEQALEFLASPDPRLQTIAQTVLEQTPVRHWPLQFSDQFVNPTAALVSIRARNSDQIPASVSQLLAAPAMSASGFANLQTLAIRLAVFSQFATESPEKFSAERDTCADVLLNDWRGLRGKTVRVAPGTDAAALRRRIAVVLGSWNHPHVFEPGIDLLNSASQEDQLAGLLALRTIRDGWNSEKRSLYFSVLNAAGGFAGGDGMPVFLKQIRADAVATLSDMEKTELGNLILETPPTDPPAGAPRPLVQNWKIDDFQSLLADTAQSGNRERGAKIFQEALCSRCHRFGSHGPAIGPDLSFISRRFSRRDMCDAILNPSKVVAEAYRSTQIIMTSGRVISGRVLTEGDFRSEKVRVQTNVLLPSSVVEIDKKEVEEVRHTEQSNMPQGLLDSFQLDEIRDLLAFLESAE